jgi:hypothetical protein
MQEDQNFAVVNATHQKISAIRLQLIRSPGPEALLEDDREQRRCIYDHKSSSVLNRGFGFSGAFRPIPSSE